MKLNIEKSKVMVFNFTVDSQFATRLYLENTLLETITQTKLLGTIIQSDLKWSENTDMIVKKGLPEDDNTKKAICIQYK